MANPKPVVGAEESTGSLRLNTEEECTDVEGGQCNNDPTYTHGDIMDTKSEDVFRVISLNINGYAKTNRSMMDKSKNKFLKDLITRPQTDVLLTQEDNAFWPTMYSENRPRNRCAGWKRDVRVHSAHNNDQREAKGCHLQGGTSTYVFDEIANRSQKIGTDPSFMG